MKWASLWLSHKSIMKTLPEIKTARIDWDNSTFGELVINENIRLRLKYVPEAQNKGTNGEVEYISPIVFDEELDYEWLDVVWAESPFANPDDPETWAYWNTISEIRSESGRIF